MTKLEVRVFALAGLTVALAFVGRALNNLAASKLAELPYRDGFWQDPRVIRALEYRDYAEWFLYLRMVVSFLGLLCLTKVDWRRKWGIYVVIAVHLWALFFVA